MNVFNKLHGNGGGNSPRVIFLGPLISTCSWLGQFLSWTEPSVATMKLLCLLQAEKTFLKRHQMRRMVDSRLSCGGAPCPTMHQMAHCYVKIKCQNVKYCSLYLSHSCIKNMKAQPSTIHPAPAMLLDLELFADQKMWNGSQSGLNTCQLAS